jgi:predicted DNA-binding transcriptional regulator AlpA
VTLALGALLSLLEVFMQDEFLNEKALAQRLSISISLLRKWRRTRQGPPWVKLGRAVRYSAAELVIWLSMRANHPDAADTPSVRSSARKWDQGR